MAEPARRTDLPTIEGESQAYWEGAREGRLLVARCGACGERHHYPRPFCPSCWSDDVTLEQVSGRGTLYTWSTVFMNDLPPFNDRLPYVAAVVELDEGPRLMTNLVDHDGIELRVGMPVEVVFQELTDTVTAPVFRPAR
jgi:uncharacterized OB-fold protein